MNTFSSSSGSTIFSVCTGVLLSYRVNHILLRFVPLVLASFYLCICLSISLVWCVWLLQGFKKYLCFIPPLCFVFVCSCLFFIVPFHPSICSWIKQFSSIHMRFLLYLPLFWEFPRSRLSRPITSCSTIGRSYLVVPGCRPDNIGEQGFPFFARAQNCIYPIY